MIRGLVNFIRDLRELSTDCEREYRVRFELSKIRQKFSDANLDFYEKKKGVLKLIYIKMKGYNSEDLGCSESAQLLVSNNYEERQAGYMGFEVLVENKMENVFRMCINTTLEHLKETRPDFLSLTLAFIANVNNSEVHQVMLDPILDMINTASIESSVIRKKLYMCVLQAYRVNPHLFDLDSWRKRVHKYLQEERDISCMLALVNLLHAFITAQPEDWDSSISILVSRLATVLDGNIPSQYVHHGLPAPILVIRLLATVALYKPKEHSITTMSSLSKSINKSIGFSQNVELMQKLCVDIDVEHRRRLARLSLSTMQLALFKESIKVVGRFPTLLDVSLVDKHLNPRIESTLLVPRYVGLQCLEHLQANDAFVPYIKGKLHRIIPNLVHADPTCVYQAFRVVAACCDKDNWKSLIPEILATLKASCVSLQRNMIPQTIAAIDGSMPKQEEHFVRTICVVASVTSLCSGTELDEYIQSLLASQKDQDLQKRFADYFLSRLKKPESIPINILGTCVYVVGEYGFLVDEKYPMCDQLSLLETVATNVRRRHPEILRRVIDAYGKIARKDHKLLKVIDELLQPYIEDVDVLVQINACELLRIMRSGLLAVFHGKVPGLDDVGVNSATLYKRHGILVTMDRGYKKNQCRILLNITNLSKSDIRITACDIKCPRGLNGVQHTNVLVTLRPGDKIGHRLSFDLNSPYKRLPVYAFNFATSRGAEHGEFQLPVALEGFSN